MLPPHIVLIKGLIKIIFKESDLNINNANSLDDLVYLTEDESKINISTIPVMENTRLNASLVDISYVEKLAEENGISLIDAVNAIQEQNDIDNISVVIDEERIISDPDIVNEINNVIIKPMSENDPVAVYVEFVCDAYLESQDTKVFDNILDKNKLTYGLRRAAHYGDCSSNVSTNNPNAKIAAMNTAGLLITLPFMRRSLGKDFANKLATAAGASYILTATYKHFKKKKKNIIEKAIIKLRRVYNSWMIKANDARVTGQGNVFKNAASVVLKIIDKLLELVQKGAHKIG